MKKVYAVRIGRKTGIFSTWEECEAQVKGFAGAKFKGFPEMSEALAWLGMGSPSTEKNASAASRKNKSAAPAVRAKKETFPFADPPAADEKENVDYIIYTDGSCLRNPNYTDSQYVENAFTKHWITNWKRNGWKTAKGTDVLNKDLWLRLDALFQTRKVQFQWVKGHVGVKYNERCDALAKAEAMKYMKTP